MKSVDAATDAAQQDGGTDTYEVLLKRPHCLPENIEFQSSPASRSRAQDQRQRTRGRLRQDRPAHAAVCTGPPARHRHSYTDQLSVE